MKETDSVNVVTGLGFKNPPFFDEFKARFGCYPVVELTKTMSLPHQYHAGEAMKFKMARCQKGDRFEVADIIPGKRSPQNVVITKLGTSMTFVVEPKMFAMDALRVVVEKRTRIPLGVCDDGELERVTTSTPHWPSDTSPGEGKTSGTKSDLQKTIEQRKENAGWII